MAEQQFNFDLDVIESSRGLPVLVDFWAQWCGPCKSLGPLLEKLAAEAVDQWSLVKIDVDAHQEISARFQVRSIPAVMLFVDGEMIAQFTGALPEGEIRSWLATHLPKHSARQLYVIEGLLQAGDYGAAMPLLEALVAADPEAIKARIYLAQRLMFADPKAAVELVADARYGDELFDRAEQVRHIAELLQRDEAEFAPSKVRDDFLLAVAALHDQQLEGALGILINTLMVDPNYDDQGARKSCIAILSWWGDSDERVRRYRQKMQRALN